MEILDLSKNKTRIVITGSEKGKLLTSIALFVLNFHQKPIDIFFENRQEISAENDFALIFGEENSTKSDFLNLIPNIAVIPEIFNQNSIEDYKILLEETISGSVLIYNEEQPEIVELVENTQKYFRKLPYKMPEFEKTNDFFAIKTSIGKIPVSISKQEYLSQIVGAKLLCQQLGVMEDEFYEAMMSF